MFDSGNICTWERMFCQGGVIRNLDRGGGSVISVRSVIRIIADGPYPLQTSKTPFLFTFLIIFSILLINMTPTTLCCKEIWCKTDFDSARSRVRRPFTPPSPWIHLCMFPVQFSVMQSDWNSFVVVFNSHSLAFRVKDNTLNQMYEEKICLHFCFKDMTFL